MGVLSEELKQRIADEFPKYPEKRAVLLTALHFIQAEHDGWIPPGASKEIAELLEIHQIDVEEVISFYSLFHSEPVGKFHIQVCANLSCCLQGARPLVRAFEEKLDIRSGEVTDDGVFSIAEVECLGSCGTAPMLQVNNEPFLENLKPEDVPGILDKLRSRLAEGKR
ncbi:MAG: NAD(P)H-dependent oxidoreductase subunit E [Candidatus Binatia bacterium]|jgi:NADH-quinone oxidoreductase E subunit